MTNPLSYFELRGKVYNHLTLTLMSVVGADKSRWKNADSFFLEEELARIKKQLDSNGVVYDLVDLHNAFYSVVYEFESEEVFHPKALAIVKKPLLKNLEVKLVRVMNFRDSLTVRVRFYKDGSNGQLREESEHMHLKDLAVILKKDPLA